VEENAPRDPDHAAELADLDPELHRLALGVPAGVLWERRLGNDASHAILLDAAVTRKARSRGRRWVR
jgi:hypothetical protein